MRNLRLPWKTQLSSKFSLCWNMFYHSGFLATCACPEKQSCPGIFHCIEYVFSIAQDFWAICSCPGKQSFLGIFHCIEIFFLSFRIFEQLALALKTEFALKFFASPRPPASYAYDQKSIINSFKNCSISNMTTVADTFWSVHVKCFHQKKIKSKRPTKGTGPAERQHKGREQLSTKNVTSKTSRLHSVIKRHKVSNRSGWNPKINCIQTKSNEIWFRKAKS